MVKIYFAASIRGGRDSIHLYPPMIEHLKKYGEVLTEHVGDKELEIKEIDVKDETIYERDMELLEEADVVVAEVTIASMGVGYELAKAESFGKKILCLYNLGEGKRLTAMIRGNKNLTVKDYHELEEAFKIIDEFFEQQL